jgi:hypothetical protein
MSEELPSPQQKFYVTISLLNDKYAVVQRPEEASIPREVPGQREPSPAEKGIMIFLNDMPAEHLKEAVDYLLRHPFTKEWFEQALQRWNQTGDAS